jgi:hypothetical protein
MGGATELENTAMCSAHTLGNSPGAYRVGRTHRIANYYEDRKQGSATRNLDRAYVFRSRSHDLMYIYMGRISNCSIYRYISNENGSFIHLCGIISSLYFLVLNCFAIIITIITLWL